MATRHFSMHYGKGDMRFSLDSSRVTAELKINDYPPLADPAAAIRDAIRNPIGSAPLREIVKPGETVTFIVNDNTRVANSDVLMPVLLDELNAAGVEDRYMQIIFALGTHRPLTEKEMIAEVGESVAGRVKLHMYDYKDDSQFVYFGTTSRGTKVSYHKVVAASDHIICTGSVVHHFFAGFGGGRKALFPGVSSYETIRNNHSFMMDPDAVIGKLHGNPIYEDQIEGAEMCRPSFLLNVVLNEEYEFLQVFAGDYIAAHLEACKFVESVYSTALDKEADLVIASCGGFPKDINIYQLQKTMDNAWCAVREGGVVIIVGECCEGSGSALYEKTMKECCTPDRVAEKLRDNFQIGAHKAYAVTRLMKKTRFILVSSLNPELAEQLLFTPAQDMEEALRLASEIVGPAPDIVLMPQGSLTVPVIKR